MDRAGDAASKTTDSMASVASGNYLLSLLLNFKVYTPIKRLVRQHHMAYGKARDVRGFASEKADQMASNIKASDARETLTGSMEYGRDKVSDGANNIEDTIGGALGYGKDKVANASGDASLTQSGMRLVMPKRLYEQQCNMEETVLRMLMMRRTSTRKRTKIWLQRIQVMRRTRYRKQCGMDMEEIYRSSNIVSEKASKAKEAASGRSNGVWRRLRERHTCQPKTL
ncbi:hypothetical protein SADUNF_Sadunf07G0020900 [Salix dunnii]|uniref:Uncharacterized protein n=1 Tax=Salix dunnii TaxID=1413687 RepID=A0A835JZH8_9ROSI|nr:hypothetical protein SADUNF_Sadunf07G0020900 [Salix dunnii]